MQVEVRLVLKTDAGEPFMGIGLVWLLDGIARTGSISEAARGMELSYPKALRMLRDLEHGLGAPVVVRRKGGAERGRTDLTPLGADFVRRYDRVRARVARHAVRVAHDEISPLLTPPPAPAR
jgi:molybdate transport system regulatory protein